MGAMFMENVLSEVYAVVLAMGAEYKIRIPDDVWNVICDAKNDNYHPFVDENKALHEQGLMKDTITFIAMLHRDYWCDSEEEREELIALFESNEAEWQAKASKTTSTRDLLKMINEI